MLHLVFYTPEIPPNTGNAMRLAAVTGARLHLIEPLGFSMDDARLRRAGMDYRDRASVTVHPTVEAWLAVVAPSQVFAFTVDAGTRYTEVDYREGDALLFGPESVGLPEHIQQAPWVTERVRLPMVAGVRSLNLSNAAAVAVYEAWRQLGFAGEQGARGVDPH
jgi:tRNA (cytidine/uridine-2'-O-)-methyltransferase